MRKETMESNFVGRCSICGSVELVAATVSFGKALAKIERQRKLIVRLRRQIFQQTTCVSPSGRHVIISRGDRCYTCGAKYPK